MAHAARHKSCVLQASLIVSSAYITIGLGVVGVCVHVIIVNVIVSINKEARELGLVKSEVCPHSTPVV